MIPSGQPIRAFRNKASNSHSHGSVLWAGKAPWERPRMEIEVFGVSRGS
jgi:hypothetical protein